MTDPYRPRPPAFPRTRLDRSGLDAGTVDRLESEYTVLDGRGRVEFSRYVNAHTDDALLARFAEGVQGITPPPNPPTDPPPAPTYETLNALTVDELEDKVREWNDAHPDQHLPIAGRKGEKIGRLLDAYEGDREQPTPTPEVSEPVAVAIAGTEQPTGGTVADQQLPTAPVPTATDGSPAGTLPAATELPATPDAGTTDTTGGTLP